MPEPTDEESLATFARCAGAYVVAAGDEGPITRRGWKLLNPQEPEPPGIAPEEILNERALLLAGAEETRCQPVLPEVVSLIDSEGRVRRLPVDGMDSTHLLAAQISEAACAVLLAHAVAACAARVAGLERLRRMRADLDRVGEGI